MEARNYAPNAQHNMILPADAQIVSGVLGNAVYLPIGCGTLEMSGTLDALGVSLWRTWDGVTEADSVRGIFSFKNFASYFDNVSGKLCVTLPGGTVVQTDIDDDTELNHWVFNFCKNGKVGIYKNAVKVHEAHTAEGAVDFTAGFTLGGGRTHATFDEVYVHTELLKEEEIRGLYCLISSGMPQQQIQEIAQSATAKYLGVTETVPDNRGVLIVKGEHLGTVYANTGDWVLMSKTVGGWKTGVCYRWSGVMWINLEPEYNYEAQYQACLAHICEIPELTQNTGHYGALFAKLIAAQEAFIEKLITSEAFINKLATNEAFIDKLVTKRLLVDSDTGNPDNFEIAINERDGILAKKEGKNVFEISPIGNILAENASFVGGTFVNISCVGDSKFYGEIDSGPLLLNSTTPHGKSCFVKRGTSGFYLYKSLKAAEFSVTTVPNPKTQKDMFRIVTSLSSDSYYGQMKITSIRADFESYHVSSSPDSGWYFVFVQKQSGEEIQIAQSRYTTGLVPISERLTDYDLFATTVSKTAKTFKLRDLPTTEPQDKNLVWRDSNGFLRIK